MTHITEWVMAPGEWVIDLTPETPQAVRDALKAWDHILVFDQEIDKDRFTDTDLKAMSVYSGVLLEEPGDRGPYVIGGHGLAVHLGLDGVGDLINPAVANTNETFANWVRDILPDAVPEGILHSVSGTLTAGQRSALRFLTPREVLDYMCETFGVGEGEDVEWRLNHDGTLDGGPVSDLYVTAPQDEAKPPVVYRSDAPEPGEELAGGREAPLRVLKQWVTNGNAVEGVAFDSGHGLKDFHGNDLVREAVDTESVTSEANADTRAEAKLADRNRTTERWELDTAAFKTQGDYRVGDWILVYDPPRGFIDNTIEVTVPGERLNARVIRIAGWQRDIGATVLHRAADGTYRDLSPWVIPSKRPTRLYLGDRPETTVSRIEGDYESFRHGDDDAVPNAPTGLGGTGVFHMNSRGREVGAINPTWTNPTLNTDGSTLTDLRRVNIRIRIDGSGDSWRVERFDSDETDPRIGRLDPETTYELQARAIRAGGNKSAWSGAVTVTTDHDQAAPSQPSAPTVRQVPGGLWVQHDLTKNSGGALEDDVRGIRVYASGSSGFTPGPANHIGTLSVRRDVIVDTGGDATVGTLIGWAEIDRPVEFGQTLYVAVKAADEVPNVSAKSPEASLVIKGIVKTDVAPAGLHRSNLVAWSADNLIQDPGFEEPFESDSDPRLYDTGIGIFDPDVGVFSQVGGNVRSGASALKFAFTIGEPGNAFAYLNGDETVAANHVAVRAGEVYLLAAWAKRLAAPIEGDVRIQIRWMQRDGTLVSTDQTIIPGGSLTTAYQRFDLTATVPTGAVAYASPRIRYSGHSSHSGAETVFVDDFEMRRASATEHIEDLAVTIDKTDEPVAFDIAEAWEPTGFALSTTPTYPISDDIDVPSWCGEALIVNFVNATAAKANSGSADSFFVQSRIGGTVGDPYGKSRAVSQNEETGTIAATHPRIVVAPGSTITCETRVYAQSDWDSTIGAVAGACQLAATGLFKR